MLKLVHRHHPPEGAGSVLDPETPARRKVPPPHFFPLAYGFIDAKLSHVDYFDTIAGKELARYYRQLRHPGAPH